VKKGSCDNILNSRENGRVSYEAKQKMSTGMFVDHVKEDVNETGFRLTQNGFKSRTKE